MSEDVRKVWAMSDAKFVGGHDANMRRNWWERPKALATNLMTLKLERIKDF